MTNSNGNREDELEIIRQLLIAVASSAESNSEVATVTNYRSEGVLSPYPNSGYVAVLGFTIRVEYSFSAHLDKCSHTSASIPTSNTGISINNIKL